jgi:hypothetical protein
MLAASHDALALDEVQPGLFDLREARAFESRWHDQDRLEAEASKRLGRTMDGPGVRAGDPAIDLILRRR